MSVLLEPISSLPGVGAQSVKRLHKLGINRLQDLVFHLPYRYEDLTKVYPIGSLSAGMSVLISGKVDYAEVLMRGRRSLICSVSDDSGSLALRFFHFNARQIQSFKPGSLISCFGEVRHGYQGLEITHPEYQIIPSSSHKVTKDCLRPVYPLTEGLHQQGIQKIIKLALDLCLPEIVDYLPKEILAKYHFPTIQQALQTLHAPSANTNIGQLLQGTSPALQRLAFEELLTRQLMQLRNKTIAKQWQAPIINCDETAQNNFANTLNFQLTTAQKRVIGEINQDCASSQPMLRLVQGDVGSGKTVVCAFAALSVANCGYQVAIMAPTELLAEQHFASFEQWFQDSDIATVYLSGNIKGKRRSATLAAMADGTANIVIGTHALFQKATVFAKLGLIIIDEQHRFGVHQRLALRSKGQTSSHRPHQLVMTATPIPRTLAMLNYCDLDISIIDEMPRGRKPIITSVMSCEKRWQIIAKIKQWTEDKHQTYWVCTLIEESDLLQCRAAEKTAQELVEQLPTVRVGLVHGKLSAAAKEAVMRDFKAHKLDLLVATTVIEVGVDVPRANLIIVENAERLGLAQIHQLRGRVGRAIEQSYCLLVYQTPLSSISNKRLATLRKSTDGFFIAEQDLKMRGPGDVMGTRQTGQLQFKIANPDRDYNTIPLALQTAEILSKTHPDIVCPLITRWLDDEEYTHI